MQNKNIYAATAIRNFMLAKLYVRYCWIICSVSKRNYRRIHMKEFGQALQTTVEWQQRVHEEISELNRIYARISERAIINGRENNCVDRSN